MWRKNWLFLIMLASLGCQKDPAPVAPAAMSTETPKDHKVQGKLVLNADLHQAFKDATVPEPPEDVTRPPDKTVAGKVVGQMYERIVGTKNMPGLWEQIRFQTPKGQRIDYKAVIQTDQGDIHLELWPDVAPNHVRNFVALANVGYFEGLAFDRTLATKIDDQPFEYLEAGCPLGTGELGLGSIGYWLKPETSDKVSHDVGTLGAWHGRSLESAACKFYITLSKAPGMDGNYTLFGKITHGLNVAQTILRRPVRVSDGGGEVGDRPVQPVIIRKVIIKTQEGAASPQVALNP